MDVVKDLKEFGFLLCSWEAMEAYFSDQSMAQGHPDSTLTPPVTSSFALMS